MFIRHIVFSLSARDITSWSLALSSLDPSRTRKIRSAFCMASFERSTPICSTWLSLSRIPAVSKRLSLQPFMVTWVSITSRVVPSMFVTIALSSPHMVFKILDLPTFGVPIIAVFIPSFIILPLSDVSISSPTRLSIFSRVSLRSV